MPRKVVEHPQSWRDKRFRKEYDKLSNKQKEACSQELRELIIALRSDAHPVFGPAFKKWRPSAYKVGSIDNLIEYRLTSTMRVIVRYFEANPDRPDGKDEIIVLMAATLSHDHARLKRLIQQHRAKVPPF